MEDNKLKPCPFCGGKAGFKKKGYISNNHTAGFSCTIECLNCGCTPIPRPHDLYISMDENGEVEMTDASIALRDNMILAWNQRAGGQE